jgi:energy-coupling factor transporter ATP-binding protein EcfA2
MLLVTGASGAGKSTARAAVEGAMSPLVECVELRDLVEIPPVPTLAWRQRATEEAVQRALRLQDRGRHLLLCGDPVAACEVAAAPSAPALEGFAACLLDVSAKAQAERLAARGDDPALVPDHQAFAAWMRAQAEDPLQRLHVLRTGGWDEMRWDRLEALVRAWRMRVIDTTAMSRESVAQAVLGWCRAVLAGDEPALRI